MGDKIETVAGDIDIATKTQFIEIKKADSKDFNSLLKQLDKYINPNNKYFMNFDKKEVILYYNTPLDMTNTNVLNEVEQIKSKGVIIVSGLDELTEVLK